VKFFDPVAALVSDEDGLFHARRILEGAPAHLNPGAKVLIETGGARHVDALRRRPKNPAL
jgi:methylase of polypeptide subunit release factors